jgi:hypothetical protein
MVRSQSSSVSQSVDSRQVESFVVWETKHRRKSLNAVGLVANGLQAFFQILTVLKHPRVHIRFLYLNRNLCSAREGVNRALRLGSARWNRHRNLGELGPKKVWR